MRWKKPRRVFVTSMGDLFHEDVPDDYVRAVFAVMERAPQHVFHVLTKRHGRMLALAPALPWPPHVWMGVTVESGRYAARADALRRVPAARRHISAEPLLGSLDELDLRGIDYVIAGGESGPERRAPDPQWFRDLRDRCLAAGVAFTFKGWGGRTQGQGGRLLDGREWRQLPPLAPVPHLRPPSLRSSRPEAHAGRPRRAGAANRLRALLRGVARQQLRQRHVRRRVVQVEPATPPARPRTDSSTRRTLLPRAVPWG